MNKENADGIRELIENFKREAVEEYKKRTWGRLDPVF